MYWPLLVALVALAFASTISCHATAQSSPEAPLTLRPIRMDKYEAAFGLRQRSSERFSQLDLQTQKELVYGRILKNEQLLLANMTLYAQDGLPIVLMEEFDQLTSTVDCNGDDGMMSLTFKSHQAFDYALRTWKYINEIDESKFLLIANHDGCGPDDERQPYLINHIREDSEHLTTFLTAQVAKWSDVAGTYDLDFGKVIPHRQSQKLKRSHYWGIGDHLKSIGDDITGGAKDIAHDVEEVADDVADKVSGTANLTGNATSDINAGTPDKKTTIFNDNTHLKLECINCFIAGKVEIHGHLVVNDWKVKDLTIDGTPTGLYGALKLEATVTKYEKPKQLKRSEPLFEAPVPDLGIIVPGIFKLGAIFKFEVGVQTQLQGSATIDFDLEARVPDTAKFTVDVMNQNLSTADGFRCDVNPIFDVKAFSATIQLAAFAQAVLSFGVEVEKVGKWDVELQFKMPQLATKMIAGHKESGQCPNDASKSKTGVEIKTQVGFDLSVEVVFKTFGGKPEWWMRLWSTSWPLLSLCFPFDIPALRENPNSSVTDLPASLPEHEASQAVNDTFLPFPP